MHDMNFFLDVFSQVTMEKMREKRSTLYPEKETPKNSERSFSRMKVNETCLDTTMICNPLIPELLDYNGEMTNLNLFIWTLYLSRFDS